MKRSTSKQFMAGAAAALLVFSLAGLARATTNRLLGTSITALRVSGSPTRPVFTVTGKGLVVPPTSPKVSPSNQKLCPVTITGNAGFDYGTQFSLLVWDGQVTDANTQRYAAGRYRPKLNELDCIGIIVLSHTPKRIAFTLGAAYLQLYKTNPGLIRNGDVVEVVLRGATFATVVHFR